MRQTEAVLFVEVLKVLGHGEICSDKFHVVFVDCVVLATIHVLLKQKRGQGG